MIIFLIVFPKVVLVGCPENTVPNIPPDNKKFMYFLYYFLEYIFVYKSVAFFNIVNFFSPQNPKRSQSIGIISFRIYTSIILIIKADQCASQAAPSQNIVLVFPRLFKLVLSRSFSICSGFYPDMNARLIISSFFNALIA